MWRRFHSLIGLVLGVLVTVVAVTGATLATKPIYETAVSGASSGDLSVADLVRNIAQANPNAVGERLVLAPSGDWKFVFSEQNRRQERVVDPATGIFAEERKEPAIYVFMRTLHRSFFLGDDGRILTAVAGVAMTILLVSGIALLLRRVGGLRRALSPIQGRDSGALHSIVGRLTFVPLLILSVTALYLSGLTFDLIPAGSGRAPAYPESYEELDPVLPWDLHGLQETPLSSAEEIVFPIPEDWFDVWAVKTTSAWVFFDQFTGDEISRDPLPVSSRVYDFIMLLHTAEGAWPWAIVLFVSSSSVPFFFVTGALVWWRNRREGRGRIKNNASAGQAEVLIKVGSEGGATWGFARALHNALGDAGVPSRISSMNELRSDYPKARLLVVMASTYGDGDAPKTASGFYKRLRKFKPSADLRHVTLAFGDKAFPDFCGFAHRADAALCEKIGPAAMPVFEIDKQSAQAFAHWCDQLSGLLGLSLDVKYEARKPKTTSLTLGEKSVYGADLGAETAILRFSAKKVPDHRPGDLVQVYPPNSTVPRLYSLGSSSRRDGFLEIMVRRVKGGQCSNWLCDLTPGEKIDIAISRNDRFQMPSSRRPVVMVGAGTGMAPFTGMIRHNRSGRPVDLFWGGRHPDSDALYHSEISDWLMQEKLARAELAWSRGDHKQYVQDRIRAERSHLIERLRAGATIMVCGGAAMAAAIREEISVLAAETGLSLEELKRRNRYLEDIY